MPWELIMNPRKEEIMHSQDKGSAKKPYAAPQVFVYGDIREVTRTVGNKTLIADGGKGSTDKTA
jgi:hypothetical protein